VDPDEFASRELKQALAMLVDELRAGIDEGLNADRLHDIVGLWEANNLNEDLTFDALVEAGMPTPCDDCLEDVTPYDDDGRPIEHGWEWCMVTAQSGTQRTAMGMLRSTCVSAVLRTGSGDGWLRKTLRRRS
jgi:hypothetical protein